MPYTKVLPEVTISELTPRKRRFFLKYLARFLLLFESVKAKGSFLDNKRVIVTAAPHQSGKDEYLDDSDDLSFGYRCLLSLCKVDYAKNSHSIYKPKRY